jgi:alpha-tubulin suppressor-like RCC1 family protein
MQCTHRLIAAVLYDVHLLCILSRDGAPWACGRGEYGRLGLGSESSKRTLEMLPVWKKNDSVMPRVTDVSLGGTHSLLLTEGEYYSYNSNSSYCCVNEDLR